MTHRNMYNLHEWLGSPLQRFGFGTLTPYIGHYTAYRMYFYIVLCKQKSHPQDNAFPKNIR